jgi:site-specific recombinase XerD
MCARMEHTDKKTSELAAKWLGEPTEKLLKSYNKETTQSRVKASMAQFCEWAQKTDAQLVEAYKQATDKEQWAKDMGKALVEWFNDLLKNGYAVNSARAAVGNVRAFFRNQCRAVLIEKRKIPKQQAATGEHEFSQAELRKMFHYADVRGKAILSTAVSLGWAADDFLNLKRSDVEALVNKALAEKELFIAFTHVRGKTGATTRAHLTPEAIESLRAYLDTTPKDAVFLWANGSLTDHLTNDTLNNILRDLVKKASIQTIGDVHFHLIRKFTMSTLSDAGLSEWDVKFMVGKDVPVDIATYLINRKATLMEEFQRAYPRLSLTGYANRNHDKLQELEEKVAKLSEQNALLWATIAEMVKDKPKLAEIRKIIERAKKAAALPSGKIIVGNE